MSEENTNAESKPGIVDRIKNKFSNLKEKWNGLSTGKKVGIVAGAVAGVTALALTGGAIGLLASGAESSLGAAFGTVFSGIGSAVTTVGSGIGTAATTIGEGIGFSGAAAGATGAAVMGGTAAAIGAGAYVAREKILDHKHPERVEERKALKEQNSTQAGREVTSAQKDMKKHLNNLDKIAKKSSKDVEKYSSKADKSSKEVAAAQGHVGRLQQAASSLGVSR